MIMTESTSTSVDRFAPMPLDIATVVVALDGSPLAERAVGVAQWVARSLHARVEVVEVVSDAEQAPAARAYLHALADSAEVYIRPNAAEALSMTFGLGDRVLPCMATHGRGRSSAVLGSVAADVLSNIDRPMLLVGPTAVAPASSAPLVVAVDGSEADDELMRVALGWARALDRRLVAITVVEPAPEGFDSDHPAERSIGPVDVDACHRSLVERASSSGVDVEAVVINNPVSVRDGIERWLSSLGPALVVAGTHRRHGLARLVRGDHAAQIARTSPGPVLAVELGLRH
jgi:nucleotide-binding universal stress UspA family protein